MIFTRLIWIPLLILASALGVTWIVWDHERQASLNEVNTQFDLSLREAVSRVDQRMATYEQMLRGAQGLFAATGKMDRGNFHDYVDSLQLDANFSGVQTIGISEWVPVTRKAVHVSAMRGLGFGDYTIQPEGARQNYAPVIQREPDIGANRTPLGFDPWSDPVRRLAMERARDSGNVSISGKVRLAVSSDADNRSGFVMYLPIYTRGLPHGTVAQRRANLIGWVYASFRINDVMASLYGEQAPGLSLAIYDGVEPTASALLYRSFDESGRQQPAAITANEYLVVAGHTWTLSMSALKDYKSRFGRNAELLIAVTGVGLSLLLALLAWLMVTGRSRAMRLAETMTKELRESEEKFRAIADCTVNLEVWWGLDRKPRWINPSVKEYTGYTVDECLAMPDFAGTLVYPEDMPRVAPELQKGIQGLRGDDLEFRCVRKDGSLFWLSLSWVPIRDAKGIFSGFRTSGRDITDRKQAEAELRIAAVAFDSLEGLIVTDANCVILRINKAFTETTGYTAEELVGKTPRVLKSGRHNDDFYRAMWESIVRTGGWQGEIWDRRKNGEIYPKWLSISAVKDNEGSVTHYIAAHHDISARKKAEERINELAFFDQLTGLPNRILLQDRLRQAMTASARDGSYGALLFIDLDNFKTLNDTLGHDMGDLLLKQVAQRMTTCVREGDTVARLGGDEFLVMLSILNTSKRIAAASTETIADKILAALNRPYQLGSVAFHSTPSIGAALFRGQQIAIDDLMKQADLAMYRAKAAGRNTVRFFDPTMETAVMERAVLEHDLRLAIDESQFLLHYQAQVESESQLTGAEALIRWQHPLRGMVQPAEFIAMAEEIGLILPLGEWVLHTACTQLAQWASQSEMAHLTIAVNVSVHQFRQRDFVDRVLNVLSHTGANPQRLKLELTESLLVSNVEDVIEKMIALKAKGVGFALDDFGTGFSSLTYLKRLPLDQLKIDQSFVRDVLTDPNDAAIAKTIIALAQSLGLEVIAEGVEIAAQRDFLFGAGCHAYQGYFFSRPLAVDDFEQYVLQN
ncbi:MAG: EAL domain-containing protein [Formivibrio sp.]|nr:EAL domain-containing protein [Formivibrio sp.]